MHTCYENIIGFPLTSNLHFKVGASQNIFFINSVITKQRNNDPDGHIAL